MYWEYRFKLMRKQLEVERNELQRVRESLDLAFADVLALHDLIARGELDEEAVGKLPRALHLFRSYARDLLRAYEDSVTPCNRALGRPIPTHCEHKEED